MTPELDAQHRAQLAEALHAATRDTCDEVECDPEFTADYCLRAIAPVIAEWLADAEQQLRARIEAALANHPDACDKYTDLDAITCGWKSAVIDVRRALDRGGDS